MPRGRVTEIYGPESSGKTTLALHVVAEAQRLGGIAAFIDAEHALDPIYATNLGVNTDELLISQPDTGEQALEIAETLVRSNAVDVIVIDSVAALVPRAELDGDMGDSLPGLQARLMSQALRKLTAAISRSGAVVIFINQIREKIGVMFGCFHYDTRVMLADGRREKIGKIVNQRMPVEVLVVRPEDRARSSLGASSTGSTTAGPTTSSSSRSRAVAPAAGTSRPPTTTSSSRRTVRVRAGDSAGRRRGAVSARGLPLTDDQCQVLLGGGLGDGSLRRVGRAHRARSGSGTARRRRTTCAGSTTMLAAASRVPSSRPATASGSIRSPCRPSWTLWAGALRRRPAPRAGRRPRSAGRARAGGLVRRRRLVHGFVCPLGQRQGGSLQQVA